MKLPFRLFVVLPFAAWLCFAQAVGGPPSAVADTGAQPSVAPPAAASVPAPVAPGPAVSQSENAAPPAPAIGGKPYVFGPLDVIEIKVWNSGNLSGLFPVGPDGLLSLPLIGQVKADGLTIPELTKEITNKLNALMNDPQVNVQLARNNSKKFYIMGEVQRQGEFPLLSDMTVLDAFANAGGFKDFASPKKIYILRDNGKQKLKFNYAQVIKGQKMEQNIHLQSGDRIVVP